MKTQTPHSIKFKRLKRALGKPEYAVVGILESLWLLASSNARLGDVGRFDNEDIAAAIEWDEDANALVTSLVDAGFLDVSAEYRLVVHDWYDHAPQFVTRHINSTLAIRSKVEWVTKMGLASQSEVEHGLSHAQPNPTQPNQFKPNPTKGSCTELKKSASVPTSPSEAVECVWPVFPTVPGTKHGSHSWRLTDEILARLRETYPGVDVGAECRKAHTWVLANLRKRKTAARMEDFLFRWLSSSHSKSNPGAGQEHQRRRFSS